MSMPPEPVTGLCILPRRSTMSSTGPDLVAVTAVLVRSCRNDAASRLSRSTRIRTSSGPMIGPVSSR